MLGFSFCDRNRIDFNNLIKIELRTCETKIMLQIVSTPKMEVDNNSEKVAILDAGAQYGKVSQLFLRTNLPRVLQTSFPGQVIDWNE